MINRFKTAIFLGSIYLSSLFGTLLLTAQPLHAISISQEKKLAKEFMTSIKRQGNLIDDPISLALVSEIGSAIVSKLPPQPFQYTFYIMDDEQFNAFAGPGANIFVNRGLITSLENVNELAGILGHEVAHAACRHISDMVDQSKLVNFGTLAGLLAGVIVGATSGNGGADLGQAVAIGSMAAGQTLSLSYSREHETEADQKGLSYIQASNFDPKGLLTGLEKIRNQDFYGAEGIPNYLKTHPGSTERIVNIQAWLDRNQNQKEYAGTETTEGSAHKKEKSSNNENDEIVQNGNKKKSDDSNDHRHGHDSANPKEEKTNSVHEEHKETARGIHPKCPIDPLRFQMVQARLAGLYGNEDEMEKQFANTLIQKPDNCAAHYGMALVLERKNRLRESLDHLRQALAVQAFDPLILVEMGRVNMLAGDAQNALNITMELNRVPEVSIQATFIQARAGLMLGMAEKAKKGFEEVIEKAPNRFPKAYYHLARINGDAQLTGNDGTTAETGAHQSALSHYYLGLYYYHIKNMKNARFHLEKSLKSLSDEEKIAQANALLKTIQNQKKNGGPDKNAA